MAALPPRSLVITSNLACFGFLFAFRAYPTRRLPFAVLPS